MNRVFKAQLRDFTLLKRKRKCWYLLLVAIFTAGVLGGCSLAAPTKPAPVPSSSTPAKQKPALGKAEPRSIPSSLKTKPIDLTFAFTGDVLSHQQLVQASRRGDGKYDYAPLTHGVKEWVHAADLAIHHQEIPYSVNNQGIAGYPRFNAPSDWAESVKELGYRGVSTASNHTVDQGENGVVRTLDTLEHLGLGTAGSNRNATENPIQYYEITKNGRTVKIAQLSNTSVLNEFPKFLKEKPWLTQRDEPEKIIAQAKTARQAGAEIVFLSTHDGTEYQSTPNEHQKIRMRQYAQSGVIDFVINHHAHVAESIEKLPGGVAGQGMWVAYGVGNLLSGQSPALSPRTQTGLLVMVTVHLDEQGKASVETPGWQGIMLDRPRLQIYTFDQLDRGLAKGCSLSSATVKQYQEMTKQAVGGAAKQLSTPPAPSSATVKVISRVNSGTDR